MPFWEIFGERGCRNIINIFDKIIDKIIGEIILVPLFPSLFSEFVERGYRIILKEVIENMMDIWSI